MGFVRSVGCMEWHTECTAPHREDSGAFRLRLHAPYEMLTNNSGLLVGNGDALHRRWSSGPVIDLGGGTDSLMWLNLSQVVR
jgi:hypothetical protein